MPDQTQPADDAVLAVRLLRDEAVMNTFRSETCSEDMVEEFCDRAKYFNEAADFLTGALRPDPATSASSRDVASIIERLRDTAEGCDDMCEHDLRDLCLEAADALSSTQPPADHLRGDVTVDWVDCPLCEGTDMRRETDAEGHSIIQCVNTCCPSNALA